VNDMARSDTQYRFNTKKYGILVSLIESFLKRSGSSMFSRQRKTKRAGTTPKPKDIRHTARRWLSPKLWNDVSRGGSQHLKGANVHPEEY